MVTDGDYTCDEYSVMYRKAEPLSCTPENKVTICQWYLKKKRHFAFYNF